MNLNFKFKSLKKKCEIFFLHGKYENSSGSFSLDSPINNIQGRQVWANSNPPNL